MDRAADWAAEAALLEEWMSLPPGESRSAFLTERCGDNPGLRNRLEALAQGLTSQFLSDSEIRPSVFRGEPEMVGRSMGPFTIREKLGEGGCGVVYRAEQERPIRREVAIKVIKLGMDTRPVIARFEAERQTLALLNHPNIAKVIDAGSTESGRPYFVMELVPGEPITRFCRNRNLDQEARLRLFLQVCEAVQHAHQKGIIHRDLKPSNILVSLSDGKALPKVIDFGVAKAAVGVAPEGMVFTQGAPFLGTPAYMSPEQLSFAGDVDTRADVYALGVLLYELLSGQPPFDANELLRLPFDEMCRTIREFEPKRPSQVRGSERPQSATPIDADLDWIVMKCLEKERIRRYSAVSALVADLQRFLRNEPVTARPPSRWYAARKAMQRHRVAFFTMGLAVVALAVAAGLTSWQAIRATRAEREMERRLHALVGFADDVLQKVHPAISDLIGASSANEALLESTVKLMPELGGSSADTRQMRVILARLKVRLGFAQGWGLGATSANVELGLNNARQAIALLSGLPNRSDLETHTLVRAHLIAGYAAIDMLQFQEALEHFDSMERLSEDLLRSTNSHFRSEGAYHKRWAYGSRGVVYIEMGDGNRAVEVSRGELEGLRARKVTDATLSEYDLLDRTSIHYGLGESLERVKDFSGAEEAYREALRTAEIFVDRFPNRAHERVRVPASRARWAEMLLSLGDREKGRLELERAQKEVEEFIRRDPGSVGYKKLHIEVLLSAAEGFARCAGQLSPSDAQSESQDARAALELADQLISELVPGSERLSRRHWQHARQLVLKDSLP